MSHSALAVQWETDGSIRDKARNLQLVTVSVSNSDSYISNGCMGANGNVSKSGALFSLMWGPKRAPHFKTYPNVYIRKTHSQSCFEVEVLDDNMDRDAVKQNIPVLKMAANLLGLRVGIGACTVHVQALYDYMQVPCPRSFGRTCHMHAWILACTCTCLDSVWELQSVR